MALAAEQGSSRLTAVLLFVVTLILVYLLCFHWFILRHREYSGEIADLSVQLGRYQRVAAQRSAYDSVLQGRQRLAQSQFSFLEVSDRTFKVDGRLFIASPLKTCFWKAGISTKPPLKCLKAWAG